VDLLELVGGEPLGPLDLRDDLVAPPLDAEAVDVVAAEQGREVLSRLAQVDPLRAHLVAVEDDLRLRLVELQVRVGEHEEPALVGLLDELAGDLAELRRLRRRGDHEVDGEVAAPRQRRRDDRDDADARDARQPRRGLHLELGRALVPLLPRPGHHAAEPARRIGDLEGVLRLREGGVDLLHLLGEHLRLVDRRVRRGLHDAEDDALVLVRGQLLGREEVERERHQDHDAPEDQDDRPVAQRRAEHPLVEPPQGAEVPVDHAREAVLAVLGAQQLRSHHGGEGQGHDPRDEDGAGEREGELPEERSGQAPLDGDRGVDRGQRDRHGDDRVDQLPGGVDRRLEGAFPAAQVPLHVLDHDDRVVHHEPDREHDGEQRQQVDGEPGHGHDEDRADERDRDRHDRDEHRAPRPEEEEDDDDDDQQRLGQGLQHLLDGGADVDGRVVGDAGRHAGRQRRRDLLHGVAHAADHVEGVRPRQHPDPHEGGRLPVEADFLLVVLGPERDVGDLAEADDGAPLLLDYEPAELLRGSEVGVRHHVDGDHRPLRPPEGGEVVVPRQRVAHLRRGDPKRRHPVRLQPDPHGEGAVAEDVGALHPLDGGELRLHHARQVVGDLVLVEVLRGEAEVHRGELVVGRLQLDDRRLGLGGEVVAHLRDLRLHLGERGVRVMVQPQVDGDRAQPLRAGRLQVVDAVGAGDDPLEGDGDEPPHEVRVRPDVGGRHPDDGHVAARELADAQGPDRVQARDQDDEVDDDGQDRPPHEEIGEFHQLSSGRGAGLFEGCTSLLTSTAAPWRSLKTPEVTTSWPGWSPVSTATWSPRASPICTNCWRAPW